MPARRIWSVSREFTLAAMPSAPAVGRVTEAPTEPRSTYRYSSLALQLLANMPSMPAPTVQPNRSLLFDATRLIGVPFAVNDERHADQPRRIKQERPVWLDRRRRHRGHVREQLERQARIPVRGPRLGRGFRHSSDSGRARHRSQREFPADRPYPPRRHQLSLLG